MTSRRVLRTVLVAVLGLAAFSLMDFLQGRDDGLGIGRALELGAVQAAGWGLLAPGTRALGRRFPIAPGIRPAAIFVHLGFAAAFALVKSAVDFGLAQVLVAGAPPAGPGWAGNAVVYCFLAGSAARRPSDTPRR